MASQEINDQDTLKDDDSVFDVNPILERLGKDKDYLEESKYVKITNSP